MDNQKQVVKNQNRMMDHAQSLREKDETIARLRTALQALYTVGYAQRSIRCQEEVSAAYHAAAVILNEVPNHDYKPL